MQTTVYPRTEETRRAYRRYHTARIEKNRKEELKGFYGDDVLEWIRCPHYAGQHPFAWKPSPRFGNSLKDWHTPMWRQRLAARIYDYVIDEEPAETDEDQGWGIWFETLYEDSFTKPAGKLVNLAVSRSYDVYDTEKMTPCYFHNLDEFLEYVGGAYEIQVYNSRSEDLPVVFIYR